MSSDPKIPQIFADMPAAPEPAPDELPQVGEIEEDPIQTRRSLVPDGPRKRRRQPLRVLLFVAVIGLLGSVCFAAAVKWSTSTDEGGDPKTTQNKTATQTSAPKQPASQTPTRPKPRTPTVVAAANRDSAERSNSGASPGRMFANAAPPIEEAPEEPKRDEDMEKMSRTTCKNDSECEAYEHCWNRRCITGTRECKTDEDCGESHRCIKSMCDAGPRECANNDECPPGSKCRFGVCREPGTQCSADKDCGDDKRCLFGTCEDGARECLRDLDCLEGYRCMQLKCVKGERQCQGDVDCPPEHRCGAGVCHPGARECGTDIECGPDGRCIMGLCKEGPRECLLQGDCSNGRRCVAGQCIVQE